MPRNASTLNPEEVREKIAVRAYEIYEDRGGQHGRDLEDWLRAEEEVIAQAVEDQPHFSRKQPISIQSTDESARAPQESTRGRRPKPSAAAH